ncbi:hypothetical protein NY2A_b635L [Paramecium bursaria Chlorella virus NY2A]|uniref:Uncharacterized protein b635L n=1 Tax=Paramecium bursaria Chlorella virus NY2A TaxID=46021 RepID=A7IXG0_PBCVN|nr:hypothetical protein NY2A_b635L [Paramecium bursaria Chlorella virus NY2A]ABT15034.1 hypothetical protein NY2A_b635L [Paramecium bursaria Chlorella virus NY2A]
MLSITLFVKLFYEVMSKYINRSSFSKNFRNNRSCMIFLFFSRNELFLDRIFLFRFCPLDDVVNIEETIIGCARSRRR